MCTRHTVTKMDRQKLGQMNRQTNQQIFLIKWAEKQNRQKDKDTNIQTNRKTDKQTDRNINKEKKLEIWLGIIHKFT